MVTPRRPNKPVDTLWNYRYRCCCCIRNPANSGSAPSCHKAGGEFATTGHETPRDHHTVKKLTKNHTLITNQEKYFNGHSDTRSVQNNFDLVTSFIQNSADKHIPSKTSRSVSSVPWITPEIRRKIRRKNKTHAKAKKTGSSKLRSKFETLRREIKADVRKQHDLCVNNLVGDVKATPRAFYQ